MPKMMENLEPEEKARMKKQMAMQSNPTEMLSSMWSDLSGAVSEAEAAGPSPSKKKIKK